MKQALFSNFLIKTLAFGILNFIFIYVGGSYLIEQYLEEYTSSTLYNAAYGLSEHETIRDNLSTYNLDAVQNSINALAAYQDTEIWILNSKNQIIVSSKQKISPTAPVDAGNFDPASWEGNYYQIGDFYGYFSRPMLSIIVPITSDKATKGYIAIHYRMDSLYRRRSQILELTMILYFVTYCLFILLAMHFRNRIQKPLNQVIKGAAEFAGGNLTYVIPVERSDEMGYLADTLNYMADKLNQNGTYQHNFIANVSHDFRSPLTSIKGYVEAMLDGTIPPEMQEKYLKIISSESSRLKKLTQKLLTLNSLEGQRHLLQKQRFDINETIKTTAATFEGICTGRKIRLEIFLDKRQLFAWADPEQIKQVIYNLLDNAIKFSEDNSSIILETTEENEKIFVSVKDFGKGIPKRSLSRIWDRFYKIDSSRGKDKNGTGLGLCIVKEIINNHGENIDVISTEGVGTEFIFTLSKAR